MTWPGGPGARALDRGLRARARCGRDSDSLEPRDGLFACQRAMACELPACAGKPLHADAVRSRFPARALPRRSITHVVERRHR